MEQSWARWLDDLRYPGELYPQPQALRTVIEEEEVDDGDGDRGETCCSTGASGTTPSSCSGEPPSKKQRIACKGCNETFGVRKSLLRHQRGCKRYSTNFNTPLESYRCDDCGLSFARPDTLRRHVQRLHSDQQNVRLQDSEEITRQGSIDDAQKSQGSESRTHIVHSTTTRPLDVSSFAFTGLDSTKCYTSAVSHSNTNYTSASELATGELPMDIDSRLSTTPASITDLQASEYVPTSELDGWTPDMSNFSHQGTSSSASSNGMTPATSNLSPDSLVLGNADPADRDNGDDADLAMLADRSLSLIDVPYASANPVSQGRNLRPNLIRFPMPCPLCGDELGNNRYDRGDARKHMEQHMRRMEAITMDSVSDSEAYCSDCQIHFLDNRDLARHQQSVRRSGGCGFTFSHCVKGDCVGHHPPRIEGHANPDHCHFKNALRLWEDFQRRAFVEYVEAYSRGMAPTNAPPFEPAKPSYRRSAGSMRSVTSLKSTTSAASTPVRFRYVWEGVTQKRLVTRHAPCVPGESCDRVSSNLIKDLAAAFAKEEFEVIGRLSESHSVVARGIRPRYMKRLAKALTNERSDVSTGELFEEPMYSFYDISEHDISAKMDASWFYPDLKIQRIRCFRLMVDQGLKISEFSVKHLAAAFDEAAARALLFTKKCLTIQSHLTKYVFLYAISRGLVDVVSELLNRGILNTFTTPPLRDAGIQMIDADFIRGLHDSNTLFGNEPPYPDVLGETNRDLGSCALILALNARQFHAAGLLIKHDVAPLWGIRYLATSKSIMQDLQDTLHSFHERGETLPDCLGRLEQTLVESAKPLEPFMSFYNGNFL